jgi:galactokinase/mevalonate kinase-like predicted kinase
MPALWDYLIVTASNAGQARAYESQLRLRERMGRLHEARSVLVVADPDGKRIGSGASTLCCLASIVNRELDRLGEKAGGPADAERVLRGLRILVVHAGGDSRRLPAYGPCGKIFVPVPGESYSALGSTLFDRMSASLFRLPPSPQGQGQVVVASGDALILFDPNQADFNPGGMTALGCLASPEEAARHGVYAVDASGALRLYLQKPAPEVQRRSGAIGPHGQAALDIGVMSIDAAAAARLMRAFQVAPDGAGRFAWNPAMRNDILTHALDLYREICCALGSEATWEHYLEAVRTSGSRWPEPALRGFFRELRGLPLFVKMLPRCEFLHFGTTRQLIQTGLTLAGRDLGSAPADTRLCMNVESGAGGRISGSHVWVEGCRIHAPLDLGGDNVVVGVDIAEPLALPAGACLDIVSGRDRQGRAKWFIRCYGIADTFKDPAGTGGTFCGRPLAEWLQQSGAAPEEIWDANCPPADRTLWNARVFPAEEEPAGYRRWLWMYKPESADAGQKQAFRAAERYSAAEIAVLADQDAFHLRRRALRAGEIRRSLGRMFAAASGFSAGDLALLLEHPSGRGPWVQELLAEARQHLAGGGSSVSLDDFVFCRIVHALASAVSMLVASPGEPLSVTIPNLEGQLPRETLAWLGELGVPTSESARTEEWAARLARVAFRRMRLTILHSCPGGRPRPRSRLRSDEVVWGRAPARIELGGGWTDTPPYSLEFGGDVINAAVNLNGQPPIHCYCRLLEEPVIRLNAIDAGARAEITTLDALLDYRNPGDGFAAAKAALALSGFSPEWADWPGGMDLAGMLEQFGGGIELTTLVGIPRGSGLGTSSILSAVVLAVLARVMGRTPALRELLHDVLRLEQAMTTGGGWQDQVGGTVGGVKFTHTEPGLIADPRIRPVAADLVDPNRNGGTTLLYYTGLTRLAKNILDQVVGGYFDRNPRVMSALAQEHQVALAAAEALTRKDAAALGGCTDREWRIRQRLSGDVTNEAIEALTARLRPHAHGMRICGAGGGGFLFVISKSPEDARWIRETLEKEPPNERARFFEYEINGKGLEVSAC